MLQTQKLHGIIKISFTPLKAGLYFCIKFHRFWYLGTYYDLKLQVTRPRHQRVFTELSEAHGPEGCSRDCPRLPPGRPSGIAPFWAHLR